MAGDYIPAPDTDFNNWQSNFVIYANANLAALGLVAGDMTPVTTAQSAWGSNYGKHLTAATAALAARQLKDDSRTAYVNAIRPLVRKLQASSAVDNSEREALGITVRDTTGTPSGPPTSRPLVKIECSRLRHVIDFMDVNTPTRKAKPPGVSGAEIWVKLLPVGQAPPSDPHDLDFVALDTKTPYTLDFDGADGGKNAHYMLRWMSTRSEPGPWSETVSVTVGA